MEENMAKFGEKLKELVALGKKKKSILELQEINDFFSDMELEAEQMDKIFEYLEASVLMCCVLMQKRMWKMRSRL